MYYDMGYTCCRMYLETCNKSSTIKIHISVKKNLFKKKSEHSIKFLPPSETTFVCKYLFAFTIACMRLNGPVNIRAPLKTVLFELKIIFTKHNHEEYLLRPFHKGIPNSNTKCFTRYTK